jgi:hypothetical protein
MNAIIGIHALRNHRGRLIAAVGTIRFAPSGAADAG